MAADRPSRLTFAAGGDVGAVVLEAAEAGSADGVRRRLTVVAHGALVAFLCNTGHTQGQARARAAALPRGGCELTQVEETQLAAVAGVRRREQAEGVAGVPAVFRKLGTRLRRRRVLRSSIFTTSVSLCATVTSTEQSADCLRHRTWRCIARRRFAGQRKSPPASAAAAAPTSSCNQRYSYFTLLTIL